MQYESSLFFLKKKRLCYFLSLVESGNWKLEPLYKKFEIFGDVGFAITLQLLAQILTTLYLTPISYDDSLQSG